MTNMGLNQMNEAHLCPKCGKEMREEPRFPGLWCCPDYKIRLNERPPYQFKCNGTEVTEAGVKAFDAECRRQFLERN